MNSFALQRNLSKLTTLLIIIIHPAKSNFYIPTGTTDNREPICMGIDSQHTYLCTDTPAAARRALNMNQNSEQLPRSHSGEQLSSDFVNLGVNQRLSGTEEEIQKVRDVMLEMISYFDQEVMSRSEYEHVRGSCRNEHELCAFWASVGECESNRVFMLQNCAAACRLCLLQATNMIG
ncbi:hypothetical protein HJC23_000173 [Cyclotella cryptica]|uniref:ShKT domain-containing protein n=1 Tax=Cyclotella cryptica TaxID=29204 RepID=A0ABD3QDU7_9STRA|eukprot:CCRYP_006333-RA/>CCRYP_006333-RA protein AED:0.24 eAED:0.24 QI:289/1/1/1/1/1/2/536/176